MPWCAVLLQELESQLSSARAELADEAGRAQRAGGGPRQRQQPVEAADGGGS
jgi:hypothetical protein